MIDLIKGLFRFVKEEWGLILLIVLVCIDRFGTVPIYLCMLLPFFLKGNKIAKSHLNLSLIVAFSIVYSILALANGYFDKSFGRFFLFLFYPLFFYFVGEYIGSKNESKIVYFLILVALSFAIFPIIFVVSDIRHNQFINVTRDLYDNRGNYMGEATITGTKVSLVLSLIGIIFAQENKRGDFILKLLLVFFSVLGLVVTLHLVNRTGLFVFGASLLISFIINRSSFKHGYLYLIIVLLGVSIYFNRGYLDFAFSESTIAYQDRVDRGSTIEGGGGRVQIWNRVSEDVVTNPFGLKSEERVKHGYGFAHNIFLDIPLAGGILSLILFVSIFIIHIKNLISLYRNRPPTLLLTLIMVFNVAFLIQLFSEPVMEGLAFYFFIYFTMIGLCSILARNNPSIKKIEVQ